MAEVPHIIIVNKCILFLSFATQGQTSSLCTTLFTVLSYQISGTCHKHCHIKSQAHSISLIHYLLSLQLLSISCFQLLSHKFTQGVCVHLFEIIVSSPKSLFSSLTIRFNHNQSVLFSKEYTHLFIVFSHSSLIASHSMTYFQY